MTRPPPDAEPTVATRRSPMPPDAPDAARALFAAAPHPQALFGPDGRLREANPAWRAQVDAGVDSLDALAAWLAARAAAAPARTDRAIPGVGTAVFLGDGAPGRGAAGRGAAAFLSRAAHQLRTPIASIYGFAELMVGPRMTPERLVDSARVVQRQSASLVRLIDLLLDLARLDARQGADFRIEAVDPAALLREAVAELPPARMPGRIALPTAAPPVSADAHWLRTALRELLDNACAYSPAQAPVTVSAEGAGGALALRIADHGAGLPAGQADAVFERFHRIGRPDDPPGHGLGLGLARDIVVLMHGRLALKARPGGGTEAVVTLPLARP